MPGNIFIWVGHPRENSLSHGLADAYQEGAETQGAEIRRMNLHDMSFDPDLTYGYHKRKNLEPCLETWRENILWANHMCWVYPYWWGGMPAKMKGVLDRALLPSFAFQYHEKGLGWDKLLKGRTGDAIITSDTPPWFDTLVYKKPGRNNITKQVFGFTGVKPTNILQVGTVKTAKPETLEKWLAKAETCGTAAGKRLSRQP